MAVEGQQRMHVMDKEPTTQELEAALQGLDYPAPRAKLLSVAYQNGASREIVNRILELPETADFLNEDELRGTFGVTIHGAHPHGWE